MPKRVAPLSEEDISSANKAERAYRLFDGGGLFLLVTPNGGRRWRFKYRFEGKTKILALGLYPEVSLNDARSRRDAARELLNQGIDPSVIRKEEKSRKRAELLEAERTPSIRVTMDGKLEIWKGSNVMRLSWDEARFISTLLNNIMR